MDDDPLTIRLGDLRPDQVIMVRCRCGRSSEFPFDLICSRKTPSFLARVFRPNSTGLERIGSNEGIEVHGRAEGIHH